MGNQYIDTVNQLMQAQQQPQAPVDPTDAAEIRHRQMMGMLGIMSGDPSLGSFGKTALDQDERQSIDAQRADQQQYQRGQNTIESNLAMGRLAQGDQEAQENRQLRRDALAQGLSEFQQKQQDRKDQASDGMLDPDTLNLAAHDTMLDPNHRLSYASGNSVTAQAVRKQIAARQTDILRDAGMTYADLPSIRANATAQVGSTKELVKQQNAIASFAEPEVANFQRLNELTKLVDTTGVPFLEQYLRKGKAMLGSDDAAEFASVVNSSQTGAAKLLNNPNLTGVLSDSARHEMQAVVDGSASPSQMVRVLNRVTMEINNRKLGIANQIRASGQSLHDLSNANASAVPGNPSYGTDQHAGNTGMQVNPQPSSNPRRVKVDMNGNPL